MSRTPFKTGEGDAGIVGRVLEKMQISDGMRSSKEKGRSRKEKYKQQEGDREVVGRRKGSSRKDKVQG